MYKLNVAAKEFYDAERNEFIEIPEATLELEHSLLSISKWEAKWKRPFLSEQKGPRTSEELIDYVRCMTLNDVDPSVYYGLNEEDFTKILEYIKDPMTSTYFSNNKKKNGRKSVITSEIIYWEMTEFGIPFTCETWNLNRLLTLIRVCDEKGQPHKKMSEKALLNQYAAVNKARRKPRV